MSSAPLSPAVCLFFAYSQEAPSTTWQLDPWLRLVVVVVVVVVVVLVLA
jgi:hypothetical protein